MLYVQVSGGNPRSQMNTEKHHNPIFTTILPRHIFTMPELSLQHGQGREKQAAERRAYFYVLQPNARRASFSHCHLLYPPNK